MQAWCQFLKNTNLNKTKGSLINKLTARKICYCFNNKQPLTLKNGIEISFNDCNNLKDAIIKYTGIVSRVFAQCKNIKINGTKHRPLTNDSFIRCVDSLFSDHFETYCIVNNVSGQYNPSS